jgi:tetratricopeptide (TPR) repeat protein
LGRAPIDVSGKVTSLLRRRRRELGWSLRQVDVRAAELLADALELGALAGGRSPGGDVHALSKNGEQAWKAGDVADALAHALAVRAHEAEDARARATKQRALVTFATYARSLGKFRLAQQILDDLLRQPLERGLLVDTLVLTGSVWRGLGSLEGALAMVERAAKRADPKDEARLARVEHQWAKLLLESSQPEGAKRHLDRAIGLYRRAKDPYNEVQARVLRTEVLEALGDPEAALACARQALEAAERGEFGRLATFARLELGRVLLARGEHDPALQELRRALASADVLADRIAQFHAHARLWKAYAALGEEQAASIELGRAAALAERVDELSEEVEEVRSAAWGSRPRKARNRRQA